MKRKKRDQEVYVPCTICRKEFASSVLDLGLCPDCYPEVYDDGEENE